MSVEQAHPVGGPWWSPALVAAVLGLAINAHGPAVPVQDPTGGLLLPHPADPWSVSISIPDVIRELGLPLVLAWIGSWLRANGGIVVRLHEDDRALLKRIGHHTEPEGKP